MIQSRCRVTDAFVQALPWYTLWLRECPPATRGHDKRPRPACRRSIRLHGAHAGLPVVAGSKLVLLRGAPIPRAGTRWAARVEAAPQLEMGPPTEASLRLSPARVPRVGPVIRVSMARPTAQASSADR
jgi:hypothetical protein